MKPLMLIEPQQPDKSAWRFVEDLQSPLWNAHNWPCRLPRVDEASLDEGVHLEMEFPDPYGLLDTAYQDLRAFFGAGRVKVSVDVGGTGSEGGAGVVGRYVIRTQRMDNPTLPEAFRIDVSTSRCVIYAGDTEGIRRGIFHIENLMLSNQGPRLPLGVTTHEPIIRTRISRCFFGPINRPPANRDELADDVNYYPDEYLNRLAHDGINAVWLTIKYRDLCPSKYFPEFGQDSARRLEKLRWTVDHCARYGIKIYPLCIEPAGFGEREYLLPFDLMERYPELAGHKGAHWINFCTSSDIGQAYLEEATFTLFEAVPRLGGLVGIQLGERPTHCCSVMSQLFDNNCPRCSKRKPGEVFADTWAAMTRGMHRVNPSAELISWIYTPMVDETSESSIDEKKEAIRQVIAHAPRDLTVQLNFESSGQTQQLGRTHAISDYSLSYVGPSDMYADCARISQKNDGNMSAKIQVGCSHETATVPFVPVPGALYRKYREMRTLGVRAAMQCWYFGNYPSPMTKAAGMLSFEPFPETEDEFLSSLARSDWMNEHVDTVLAAWKNFQDAYEHFPAALQFSWYGPVHDSVAWPLHLVPVDRPIAPSWQLGFAPSGDRIGECFAYDQSWEDVIELCCEMTQRWDEGVQRLESIESCYEKNISRRMDISVAKAMGVQLRSAWNVVRFYALREALPYLAMPEQLEHLDRLREIVADEINNSQQILTLAQTDSRLGFHSEAEGYKYFPEKLTWRIDLLQALLANEFSWVEQSIRQGEPLFPAYTGRQLTGAVYRCAIGHDGIDGDDSDAEKVDASQNSPDYVRCESMAVDDDLAGDTSWQTVWRAEADPGAIRFHIKCDFPAGRPLPDQPTSEIADEDHVIVSIEPRRLWPAQRFIIGHHGATQHDNRSVSHATDWHAQVTTRKDGWDISLVVGFDGLGRSKGDGKPMRINIERHIPGTLSLAWVERHPLKHRLLYGTDNPTDLGWFIFQPRERDLIAPRHDASRIELVKRW